MANVKSFKNQGEQIVDSGSKSLNELLNGEDSPFIEDQTIEKENPVKKERKTKPAVKKIDNQENSKTLFQVSYMEEEEMVEAVRKYAFDNRVKKSEVINEALRKLPGLKKYLQN